VGDEEGEKVSLDCEKDFRGKGVERSFGEWVKCDCRLRRALLEWRRIMEVSVWTSGEARDACIGPDGAITIALENILEERITPDQHRL
jgi:hypothetical protein